MPKGELSLEFIVSLIILTIVAITVIGIFLTVMKPPEFQCETQKPKINQECTSKCNDVKLAKTLKSKREAIFEYCTTHFNDVCSGEGDLVSNIYVQGSGYNSFCRDRAYCFNYPQAECLVDGESLNPKNCLDYMCSTLKEDMTESDAEEKIKNLMKAGKCELKKEAHEEIVVDTWWQKYFKNPNCGPGGPEGGGCVEFCRNTPIPGDTGNYSGATEDSCVKALNCNKDILTRENGAPCPESDNPLEEKVCCCIP